MTNKYNRRARPNLRHLCEFWVPSAEPDASGELKQEFILHYRSSFSMEVPLRPQEIGDAGRVITEQTFVLIGQWCKPASQISTSMFCVIPSLQKVYAVQGQATDPFGDRRKVHIRIIDNVSQPTTIQLLPTMY